MTDALRSEMEEHHARLNRDAVIDPAWYRREARQYECICYINHIVGAYYSGNHEVMGIFLRRAHEWFTKRTNKGVIPLESRIRVLAYLKTVAKFLAAAERVVPPRVD
jgi:hypothetical protein